MKITKKIEAEIKLMMEDYWGSYIKGNLKHWASYLVDDYQNIGTTEAEIWNSKKEIYDYSCSVLDQMVGLTELRNKKTEIIPYDPYVMVHEFLDIYIKAEEEWIFYSKLRLSSLIQKIDKTWKILHQHGSYPDSKVTDGEFFAFDKLKSENLKLQEAVKSRTLELELSNRELEIEAALEKVRAIALSMKEPADMLDVCKSISQQLQSLGVKEIRNVQTAIFYEQRGTYMNYEYYSKHKKRFITETVYTNNKIHKAFALKMLKGKGEIFTTHIKGRKVKEWIEYQKTTNVFIDKYLNKASSLNYYWFSLGPVALGISTYDPLTEEETNLFNRFLKVFELAYQRYLDIEKAEAQAREAQIEVSLERVRSRALAMHSSEELNDVLCVLFEQFDFLGINPVLTHLTLFDEENKTFSLMITTSPENRVLAKQVIDVDAVESWNLSFQNWKNGGDGTMDCIDYTPGVLPAVWEVMHEVMNALPKKHRIYPSDFPDGLYTTQGHCKYGYLGFNHTRRASEEEKKIVGRFAAEFGRLYQRFLDLQKAEAQAREAKVEASLERVRSLALGMRKSEEVGNVTDRLFTELIKLSVDISGCSIVVIDEDNDKMELWRARSDIAIKPFESSSFTESMNVLKKYMPDWFPTFYNALEKRKNYLIDELSAKRRSQFLNAIAEQYKYSSKEKSKLIKNTPEKIATHYIFFKLGYLALLAEKKLNNENLLTVRRFVEVFDFSYTRYLDLQNAEKQAREAEIQLAMERVRARTMAMQKSDELPDAANLLFQQVQSLGMIAWSVGYCLWEDNRKAITLWMSSEGVIQPSFKIPTTDEWTFIKFREAYENGESFLVFDIGGNEITEHYNYLKNLPGIADSLKKIEDEGHPLPTYQIFHCAYFSHGFLLFITYEPVTESWDIFKRFAGVFEQTYTRFLDLQKAEAQAREAQIEASLERVRARSMAMHKSEELADLSFELVKQVQALGVATWFCTFNIYDDDPQGSLEWGSNAEGTYPKYRTPREGIFLHYYEAGQRGETLLINEIGKNECAAHYDYLCSLPGVGEQLLKMKEAGLSFPESQIDHVAYFKYGYIIFITFDPATEAYDIFKRFAKVFEQTYTRLLDLKKAEAQAREAEIELALERVRARSMAMQKSDELKEVIQLVYEQFVQLKINIEHTGFIMDYKASDDMHIWLADKHEVPSEITIPYFDSPHWNSFNEAKEKGKDFFTNHLTFEEKNKFYGDLFKLILGVPEETLEYYFSCPGLAISTVLLENVGLYIENFSGIPYSDDENHILMRFGKVFQQTYTRFNDLKQAEAQARESQIEAALERVRSRSMGMQKSEELKDVIQLVYEQFIHLKINVDHAGIVIDFTPKGDWHFWIADQQGTPSKITHPYFDSVWALQFNEAKEKGIDFFATNLNFEEKNKFYKDLFKFIPDAPDESLEFYFNSPGLDGSTVLLENVALYIENFTGIPYSDDENNILMRFGKVFQQTYTRFLDLQKAEAQTREAQIEAALEKVRSRSLAMHNSNEIKEVVVTVMEKMNELNIEMNGGVSLATFVPDSNDLIHWYVNPAHVDGPVTMHLPYFENVLFSDFIEARKSGKEILPVVYSFVEKNEYFGYAFEHSEFKIVPQELKKWILEQPYFGYSVAIQKHSAIFFNDYTGKFFSEKENEVLIRFAKVFDQAYIRFLDLKKAEAQAREAQIESSMERVRAHAMGLRNSEELRNIIAIIFEELKKLGLQLYESGIFLRHGKTRDFTYWGSGSEGAQLPTSYQFHFFEHPILNGVLNDLDLNVPYREFYIEKDELTEYGELLFNLTEFKNSPQEYKDSFFALDKIYVAQAIMQHGFLEAIGTEPLPNDLAEVMKRFTNVIDLTYTRFLDLQKAEAQTREAQIEAAMEHIRNRTLLMKDSSELNEAVAVFFQQFQLLNLLPSEARTYFCNIDTSSDVAEVWMTQVDGIVMKGSHITPLTKSESMLRYYEAWKRKEPISIRNYSGKELKNYLQFVSTLPHVKNDKDYKKLFKNPPKNIVMTDANFKQGNIGIMTYEPLGQEALDILMRFAKVFEFTYTRFQDLQKAEAQARQARIETAMEKVRARALAMQKPEELIEVAQVLRKEMGLLGVEELETSSIYIHDEESGTTECWYAIKDVREKDKKLLTDHMTMHLDDTWVGREMMKFYRSDQNQTSILMQGENRKEWINYCAEHSEALQGYYGDVIPERTYHLLKFSNGFMGAASPGDISEQSWDLLHRATSVFAFAYTRFRDLQQAEARAIEAIQQASLDRVRAEIASMRTTDDLQKITPIIWRELTTLGVPFFRCGVFIFDEYKNIAHAYLSTPQGKSLAALHVNIDNTWLENAVKHWRKNTIYHEVWDKEKFLSWTKTMMDQGFIENKEQFQAGKEAPETLSLQLFPFRQGMLYVGSKLHLSEEEIKLAQRLANDFGVAYSRYQDFEKLEAANQRKSLELEEARQLQLAMLPKELPTLPNLELAVYMETATEVGGDYYDFYVGEDGMLTSVIGDATGHGMKAGTMVTITKSLFNTLASGRDILKTFSRIAQVIKSMKFRQLSMCLQIVKIKDGNLSISSAAMPPIYIYHKNDNSVEEILLSGMPLGAMNTFQYKIDKRALESGDVVLMLSDGLPELVNGKKQMYGYDRIKNELKEIGVRSPQEIVEHLKDSAAQWLNGNEADDDITFVVIKVK